MTTVGRGDGAAALLGAVLATLLLALLLPPREGAGGPAPASAHAVSELRVPGNLTPALGRIAVTAPAREVSVIVQMQPGSSTARGRSLVRAAGGAAGPGVRIINGFGARMSAAAAMNLATHPGVKAVSLDGAVKSQAHRRAVKAQSSNGPRTSYGASTGATEMFRGWRGLSGKGIGVAVVDTGVAGDLADFRVSRKNRLSRIRVSAVVNPRARSAADGYGHGTHVAGLIAGNGANRDVDDPLRGKYEGVAPRAHLISIKASDEDGSASVLDAIYGIQFAVDHKDKYRIRVLNLSLSSTVADSYLNDPLAAAAEAAWFNGLVVVAAAGNSGTEREAVSYAPGSDPYVISVGAIDDMGTDDKSDDRVASWSSRGETLDGHAKPDVLAPGAHMVSNLAPKSRFEVLCPECVRDREYFQVGGTSMSAAVVSGIVAQLLEAHRNWTPDQVKAALVETQRRVAGGGSEVDAMAAVRAVVPRDRVAQDYPVNPLVDRTTGEINTTGASWRGASWRIVGVDDPLAASFAAASWRCDCSLAADGSVEPAAASWRAASWRTSFNK